MIGGPARCRVGGDRATDPVRGRITIVGHQPPAPIQWRCNLCADEGVISNWEDSPYDLRRRRLTAVGALNEINVTDEVAAALRGLSAHYRRRVRLARRHALATAGGSTQQRTINQPD